MDFINDIKAELINENGITIPSFIFQVTSIARAEEFIKLFRITPMPIDVPLYRKLLGSQKIDFPEDALVRIELAFEDPLPDNAYETYLNKEEVAAFSKANYETKKIKYCMEEKDPHSGKINRIDIYTDSEYILDWGGVLGNVFIIRITTKEPKIEKLINVLELHVKESGYASGMLTELGYLYKLSGDYEKARILYTEEIKLATNADGKTQPHAAKAINNLGVICKGIKDIKNAMSLFKLAIALNNNYFEAHLNLAGIINDYELSIKCIARAYKIRPDTTIITSIIENTADFYNINRDNVIDKLNSLLGEIDLSKPQSELGLVDLNSARAMFL